jgi:hypothetical protein
LRGERSHTEYRTETYQDTCYNSVLDHYETRCTDEPITVCNSIVPNKSPLAEQLRPGPSEPHDGGGGGGLTPGPSEPHDPQPDPWPGNGGGGGGITPGPSEPHEPDPGPACHTEYRQSCSEEPVYRDEAYECTKTREIPYTVHDGDSLAHVVFNFGAIPAGLMPNDTFNVSSSGNKVAVSIQSGSPALYRMAQQTKQDSSSGTLLETTTTINVTVDSIAAINLAVTSDLTQLTANTANVSFIIGKVLYPEYLITSLKIEKSVFLGHKTLIDRDLQASEITLTPVGATTRVDIKVSALGLDLSKKSLKIRAKVRLNVPAGIAPGLISTAQPEQTIKIKL